MNRQQRRMMERNSRQTAQRRVERPVHFPMIGQSGHRDPADGRDHRPDRALRYRRRDRIRPAGFQAHQRNDLVRDGASRRRPGRRFRNVGHQAQQGHQQSAAQLWMDARAGLGEKP